MFYKGGIQPLKKKKKKKKILDLRWWEMIHTFG